MTPRHLCRIPRTWLVTDQRVAVADLLRAAQALPRGSGILLRQPDDRMLAQALARIARRRGLLLSVAADDRLARRLGGTLRHNRARGPAGGALPRSMPVHDLRQLRRAERAGAACIFLSPVFPTRSHPGAPTLGRYRFASLARLTRLPVIALGGMTRGKAKGIPTHGWAAIDGLLR